MALDLEAAYNKVDYKTIIAAMDECRIDPWILGWIAVALRVRIVALKFEGRASEIKHLCPGLPKGSSLSAVLFNIYTAVVARINSVDLGRVLTFIDDILLLNTETDNNCVVTCKRTCNTLKIGIRRQDQALIRGKYPYCGVH